MSEMEVMLVSYNVQRKRCKFFVNLIAFNNLIEDSGPGNPVYKQIQSFNWDRLGNSFAKLLHRLKQSTLCIQIWPFLAYNINKLDVKVFENWFCQNAFVASSEW